MNKTLTALLALTIPVMVQAQEWKPAGDNIRSRWADEITPQNVLGEYPRPQMEREDWQSLNGLWDYSITNLAAKSMSEVQGSILVPFAIESSLSGVGKTITADDALWYKRNFSIPSNWRSRRILLHFDAVDWGCQVFVNGKLAGSHTGGYTAFSMDITKLLKPGKNQVLEVKVTDATENDIQPHGKQVKKPRGIWYTPVSGIWQSVWMEAVSKKAYITDYKVKTDIATGTLTVLPEIVGKYDKLVLEISDGDKMICTESSEKELSVKIDNPKLWSPDSPTLYDFVVKLILEGKTIDKVKGYTALRSISMIKDNDGHMRMALNGDALFHFGPLDQGWWPDGLYTAPCDDALKYDIEVTKMLGYNMIRKHIKVEPARWYYWCDKLGIMVWQDMPSIGDNSKNVWSQGNYKPDGSNDFDMGTDYPLTDFAKDNFRKEWREIMQQLDKFQCIVVWVPFNEGWAQFDTKEIEQFTRSVDNTRLINIASGGNWVSGHVGDILDSHHYPYPKMRIWDSEMVNVLGEYGGIGLPVKGHLWQKDKNWGYVKYSNGKEVTDCYVDYIEKLIPLIQMGCSAAVYTQTTDVEGEVNGLMTYDRDIIKPDIERVASANRRAIESMSK